MASSSSSHAARQTLPTEDEARSPRAGEKKDGYLENFERGSESGRITRDNGDMCTSLNEKSR